MKKITFDYSNAKQFISEENLNLYSKKIKEANEKLKNKNGPGNDFLGWLDLPKTIDKIEIDKIKKTAQEIRGKADVLLVIGIGGSYLGARAAIEFMNTSFHNNLNKPEIYFVGNNLSSRYITKIKKLIENKEVVINVISKSGTTTEPAISFRVFKEILEKKYTKEEVRERIYATTDSKNGALLKSSQKEGYETFIIPSDVGGRYSVLTPVGLLPIAVAGIDIEKMLEGAQRSLVDSNLNFEDNHCFKYAIARNILHQNQKGIEILVNYEPDLHFIAEWWKQLFGESEGKDKKGIFPASVDFTSDLHSMGQYIQDGKRNIFETVLNIKNISDEIILKADNEDLDELNYLEGKSIDYVNKTACKGTIMAHVDGNVPNLVINIDDFSEYSLGYLFYFFEKACALSGYLLGVNPFDQPGVEKYKANMFKLLEKKGY